MPLDPSWSPISKRDVARKVPTIVITFFIALVVTLAAIIILVNRVFARDKLSFAEVWPFGLEFACFAAGFAAIIVVVPLNRRLREIGLRDIGQLKKFANVVLRNKPTELQAEERVGAARYAALMSVALSFQLAYVGLLYVGLLLQQFQTLGRNPWSLWLIVMLLALFVLLAPLTVIRVRRAQRYARKNADLLTPVTA